MKPRSDLHAFQSIRERDTDLLLLEEFSVSAPFREWFLHEILESPPKNIEFVGGWHSVTDAELGESDLEFGVRVNDNRVLILVENKIDATFQDDQLPRYRERGREALDGPWDEFQTCLFAPQAYLSRSAETDAVDSTLGYESVRDWFETLETPRSMFKADMLTAAIEQQRRGYHPEPDEQVTNLYLYYWEIASENYPEVGMEQPTGVPSGNSWIRFKPLTLPDGYALIHKMERGDVDLQFAGEADRANEFIAQFGPELEPDMEIVETGKSMSIRLSVPPIDLEDNPASQREEIRAGLKGATRLLEWFGRQSG